MIKASWLWILGDDGLKNLHIPEPQQQNKKKITLQSVHNFANTNTTCHITLVAVCFLQLSIFYLFLLSCHVYQSSVASQRC